MRLAGQDKFVRCSVLSFRDRMANVLKVHRKKRFTSFPSPAGMSLTKLPLGRNNSVMTALFPPRESLVVTSLLGKGNSRTFFLRCTLWRRGCRYKYTVKKILPEVWLGVQEELEEDGHKDEAVDEAQADDDEDHLEEDEVAGAGGEQHTHHAQNGWKRALHSKSKHCLMRRHW